MRLRHASSSASRSASSARMLDTGIPVQDVTMAAMSASETDRVISSDGAVSALCEARDIISSSCVRSSAALSKSSRSIAASFFAFISSSARELLSCPISSPRWRILMPDAASSMRSIALSSLSARLPPRAGSVSQAPRPFLCARGIRQASLRLLSEARSAQARAL